MSGHQVLSQAGEVIRLSLFDALKEVGMASGGNADVEKFISLAPPPEKGNTTPEKLLSLWLYFVSENEHAKNRPPTFVNGTLTPPPLALTLYYLLTPGTPDANNIETNMGKAANALGAALQAMHNRPIIPLSRVAHDAVPNEPAQTAAAEELHLSLCRLSVEELARIWEALDHPYRLSVCLKANIVRIDSLRTTIGKPVLSREFISGRLTEPARPAR